MITTSLSSKLSSCSPHSLLTSQLFPLSKGQQLIVKGIKDSSVVCSLHFSTPTSLFTGNDFSGFFKPMRDSAVKSFLSTFGCVWNEKRSLKFRVTSKGARQDGSVGKGPALRAEGLSLTLPPSPQKRGCEDAGGAVRCIWGPRDRSPKGTQVYCIDNIDLSSFHLSIQGQKKLCVRPVPVAQSYASCRQW